MSLGALAAILWVFYHPGLASVNFGYSIYPLNLLCASGVSIAMIFLCNKILSVLKITDIRTLSFLGERSLQVLCVHQITYHLGTYLQLNDIDFFLLNLLVPISYVVLYTLYEKYLITHS